MMQATNQSNAGISWSVLAVLQHLQTNKQGLLLNRRCTKSITRAVVQSEQGNSGWDGMAGINIDNERDKYY
jgi:hypothetical protein